MPRDTGALGSDRKEGKKELGMVEGVVEHGGLQERLAWAFEGIGQRS